MRVETRRAFLVALSILSLSSQTVLAQGDPGLPLWQQSVCMSVLTAFGLLVAPPEMIIDLARERFKVREESKG